MKKYKSIKKKLIINTMIIISIIFIAVLSIITFINVIALNANINKSKSDILDSIIRKGNTLTYNNSLALPLMIWNVDENAVLHLVSSTLKGDTDIIYGIVMDTDFIPWTYASIKNPSGIPKNKDPLKDQVSKWAGSLKSPDNKTFLLGKEEVIEFAAPIIFKDKDKLLGFIRYGLSTKSMHKGIQDAQASGVRTRNQILFILFFLCLFSLCCSYFIVRRLASKITRPINELVESAKTISMGNYNISVKSDSNDEVGNLAENFESMRVTIKRYTDHLQDIIDEKMRQVNDILNNIDQGLFTINLDGSVNKEYSLRANTILKMPDISSCSIQEIFRLDSKQMEAFNIWLKLVREKHAKLRWHKLIRIAPIQNLELINPSMDNKNYISISYQKILDRNNDLSKIMVLALDITEKRIKDIQIQEQREKHENEMKTILSLVNTPPEDIAEFMEDTKKRLQTVKESLNKNLSEIQKTASFKIDSQEIDSIYRDMHTIKGNSGSYNFDMLSAYSHRAEDLLEELRCKSGRKVDDILKKLNDIALKIDESLDEINNKSRLIFGQGNERMMRISKSHIRNILDICLAIDYDSQKPEIKKLIEDCNFLSWKPIKSLTRKYQQIIAKIARKLNKKVEFIIKDELAFYPENVFEDIDEALIHIFRNAVAHGIEFTSVRQERGKGIGRVIFEFNNQKDQKIFKISDDGNGIDYEMIVANCVKKGIISNEEGVKLSYEDKIKLMYLPNSSTANEVSDISGRGIGMNIVLEKVKSLNGNISIETLQGQGTTFIIVIPYKQN